MEYLGVSNLVDGKRAPLTEAAVARATKSSAALAAVAAVHIAPHTFIVGMIRLDGEGSVSRFAAHYSLCHCRGIFSRFGWREAAAPHLWLRTECAIRSAPRFC